jgi:glycosyltransferase involved in cell wall biosynthesis
MKVLIVCSGNAPAGEKFDLKLHQAFIYEQVEALKAYGVEFDFFFIKDKGIWGYIKHYKLLIRALGKNRHDLIHAHNGLSGFIANFQSRVPVVTTYHGSDINLFFLRLVSYFPLLKSSHNIFVSEGQLKKVLFKKNISLIPCGVDLNVFHPLATNGSTNSAGFKKQILFSSSFSISIKNYPLALAALKRVGSEDLELTELKDKSRDEVCNLLNRSELLLLTSFSEGSPMVIKEAMACNCPIVTTGVGDVKWVLGNTEGCYITSFDPQDIAEKIKLAIEFRKKHHYTNGRQRIIELGLDSETIAGKVIEVYRKVLRGRGRGVSGEE